ncbi:MAG: hypothetical protein JW904_10870 [Spirochaetales bacterium]|nr:hypothetical protein [Spirochaetales bacterium]
MAHSKLFTINAPKPVGPYSQATLANGFIFTAGQIALNPKTNSLVVDSFENETRQVLENLRHVLAAGNAGFDDVVSTSIYCTDLSYFSVINQIYETFMGENKPARTTIQAAALPLGARVEISMIAAVR